MSSDTEQWQRTRHRFLVEGTSRKQVVRETGTSINTVRKMLTYSHPVPMARDNEYIRSLVPTSTPSSEHSKKGPPG